MYAVKRFFSYSWIVSKSELREAIAINAIRLLRDERQYKGISMTRLAEGAGLSQGMISLVERDLRNPTLDTLLRMAEVLEVDLWRVLRKATDEASLKKRV